MPLGKVEAFDINNGNWQNYIERIKQYYIVNDVKEERQTATLITLIGPEAYDVLTDLCSPQSPKGKTFEELVEIFQQHVQPTPSPIAERYSFRQRRQQVGETVINYIASLKKLAKYCNFGKNLNENLRDQLVCGISCEFTRQTLFTHSDINLEDALKIAINLEAAGKNSKLVYNSGSLERAKSISTIQMSYLECSACGRRGHAFAKCYYKDFSCRICKKKGHLQKMCPSVNQRTKFRKINFINEREGEDDSLPNTSGGAGEGTLYWLNKNTYKPILHKLIIETQEITMEIDTGSAISCVSESLYLNKFRHLFLKPSDIKLKYYTGETFEPLGYIEPKVECNHHKKRLQLYVIKNGKTALLGRQWLYELSIGIPVLSNMYNVIQVDLNKKNVNSIFDDYSDVFSEDLGCYNGGYVHLYTQPDAVPRFLRARPVPFAIREKIDTELELMIKQGVIQQVNTSEWATPIVPIIKPNGRVRICADYKVTVNPILKVDRYPLPTIDELLARFDKGQKFSKIDLSQAYLQVPLDEVSKGLTVINTHKGLFKFNRLVFGLSSSPAIFQRLMSQIFGNINNVAIFLDDILVSGATDEEHIYTLKLVLDKLKANGLKVNKAKCLFFQDSVEYLGYTITANGISTTMEKVDAVLKMTPPRNVTELRSFLGTVNYYAKFIKGMSSVLSPLYSLLKLGSQWQWSESCDGAFRTIKELLSAAPILMHFNENLPVVLTCDASAYGLGTVLSHRLESGEERPIAYASRTLNIAEKKYSQIDKEALAIIFGIKKFHQFLFGRKFILRTDHKPLTSIFGSKKGIPLLAASRLQRWAIILTAYQYDIEYISSVKNVADIFSRLPLEQPIISLEKDLNYINYLEENLPISCVEISKETDKDEILSRVKHYVLNNWPMKCPAEMKVFISKRDQLYVEGGCLMWGYKVVVPTSLRQKVLNELHKTHLGIVKTKSLARSYVWWPRMDQDIECVCRACFTCICENSAPPKATPQPWPVTQQPWSRLHLDLLGPIDNHTFLVIIDATSKWIEIFNLTRSTAAAVIKPLWETFARFGVPQVIVTDNGPPFSSLEFENFVSGIGIKHLFSAIHHPSSNGAAENAVKICKQAIKKALRDEMDVDLALQRFLLDYRNVEQSSTHEAPAYILQGRRLRTVLDLLKPTTTNESQRIELPDEINSRRIFLVGDKVWCRSYSKNSNPYILGEIVQILGTRNFKIKIIDPLESTHLVDRHIDQLKRYQEATVTTHGIDNRNNVVSPILPGLPNLVPATNTRSDTQTFGSNPCAPTQTVPVGNDIAPPPLRRSSRNVRPPDRLHYV